ncbi:MAG: hypothetical protein PUC50_07555 [Bacteroidales bacterium]|nr:hypothetical protein [Bacteroidales bacterium]
MKNTIILIAVFLVSVSCFGQNNQYQMYVGKSRYYDPNEMSEMNRQLEQMTQGHNQAQNQIWDNLERINNLIRQGDYENANLLIDRCIQLNAQWQYNLIDHNTLVQKKDEIAKAKSRSSYSQNNYQSSGYNNYNNYNNSQSNYYEDDITKSYRNSFNSYVKSAYGEYELGNYADSRNSLNEAYRIYEQQKLSLTQQESDSYNRLNDMLSKVENTAKAIDIRGLINTYSNGSYGIANYLSTYGFRYSHDNNGAKNYISGNEAVNGSVSVNDNQKMILYFLPASFKSKIFNDINSFATFRGNRKDNENGMEYQGFVYSNFYIELSTKTIPMSNNQFYILRLFKVEQATNNANNTTQDNSVNEQNYGDVFFNSAQQYITEIYSVDSLTREFNREGISNADWYRLQQEIKKTQQNANKHKDEYLKAFVFGEQYCNKLINNNKDLAFAYGQLGWLYDSRGIILDKERYLLDHSANSNITESNKIYQEERKFFFKALSYFEKLYNLDNGNTKALNQMLQIRKDLALDEYHPTYIISPSDIVIKYPDFKEIASDNIVIKKVIISDTQTVVELSNTNKKNGTYYLWITIDKDTYINVNGKKYFLTKAEGIGINPDKTYFYAFDQAKDFALYFPPIPKSTTKMDLIEPGTSDWKFYDIQLK